MHDDLLLYKSFATFKPVVGSEAAKEIIPHFIVRSCWYHEDLLGYPALRFVPKLLTMITEIVNACDTCQRTKSISRYMGGLMMPSEVPVTVLVIFMLILLLVYLLRLKDMML